MDTLPLTPVVDPRRHDMYYAVHKGLRFGHARLLTAIGRTDFADAAATDALVADLRAFLRLAECHLESEEREIHAAVEAISAGASHAAHDEHEEHERSFAELEAILERIEHAPAAARPALGRALYARYARFMAADLAHMAGEESELLPTLHRLFDDEALQAIEGRIVAAIPPANLVGFMRLIMPAMNPGERSEMLGAMKAGMPPEAFAGLLNDAVRPALTTAEFAALRLDP